MTLVGKIFVVAILIMSVVYMGFAMAVYSAHTNWYDAVNRATASAGKPLGLAHQLTQFEKEKEELQLQLDGLQRQLASVQAIHIQQLSKLETERETMRSQVAALEAQRDTLVQDNRKLSAALDTATQDNRRLTDETVALRAEIRETQQKRDDVFAQLVAKTDELHDAQGKLVVLKEREAQLVQDLAKARRVLKANGMTPDDNVDSIPPNIAGLVTAVREKEYVEVSIGADDGIKQGQTLEVFRGRTYLGRVEILQTSPDRAVAKVLADFRRGDIQKGDRVATRIKLS